MLYSGVFLKRSKIGLVELCWSPFVNVRVVAQFYPCCNVKILWFLVMVMMTRSINRGNHNIPKFIFSAVMVLFFRSPVPAVLLGNCLGKQF